MHKCDCGPASLCKYPKCPEGIPLPSTNKERTVTIPHKQYVALLKANTELEALYAAGVDNWDGYPYHYDEEDEDESE